MFNRDINLNKYYKNLRKNVFNDLPIEEYIEVFEKL